MRLRFRPHHFLCAVGFRGKGYSDAFVTNFQEVAGRLRGPGGEELEIEVTGAADSICAPCPNRRGELCETETKIRRLDDAHAEVLGLSPGQVLTWGEAQARIAGRFTVEVHRRACDGCGWLELGICEQALLELQGSRARR